jgi:hypothetical protein
MLDEKDRYFNQPKSKIYDLGGQKRRQDSYAIR